MSNNETTNQSFDFQFDEKATVWYRTKFTIEASSVEEAKEKAIEKAKNNDTGNIPWEILYETTVMLQPEDNGNEPTAELYIMDKETHGPIYTNKRNIILIK
jgi:hypothetical protein